MFHISISSLINLMVITICYVWHYKAHIANAPIELKMVSNTYIFLKIK
jgi:hypothetical protein